MTEYVHFLNTIVDRVLCYCSHEKNLRLYIFHTIYLEISWDEERGTKNERDFLFFTIDSDCTSDEKKIGKQIPTFSFFFL